MTIALHTRIDCPYCTHPASKVTGRVIYPHRPDLYAKQFFQCVPCDAYVGCHPDGRPLGRLANPALRKAKMAAHAAFDPLWQDQRGAYPDEQRPQKKLQRIMRARAYQWLAAQMGMDFDDTHIGMFDVLQCKRVVEVVAKAGINAAGIRQWAQARKEAA